MEETASFDSYDNHFITELLKEMGLDEVNETTLRQLKIKALFDERTGLLRYNEKAVVAYIQNCLKNLSSIYYLRFDLDDFSSYNKKHGHRKGDEMLRAFGQFLLKTFPKGRVYRYGGDEFDLVSAVEGKPALLIDESKDLWTKQGGLRFSCGYEIITKHSSLVDIQNACDEALFRDKSKGI